MPTEPRLVLTASRTKWAAITAMSAVFVAVGIAMAADGSLWGWASILFFGFCGLVAATQLVRPGRLVVHDDAFEVVRFGRVHRYEFARCGAFSVWREPRHDSRLVVFDHEPDRDTTLGRANTALMGVSTGIGDTFGRSAEELAATLEAARRRASG